MCEQCCTAPPQLSLDGPPAKNLTGKCTLMVTMASTMLHTMSYVHSVALERKRPCAQSDAAISSKKGKLSELCSVDHIAPSDSELSMHFVLHVI